ncbi:MAG TPA: hypothetical protein VEG28_01760 [Dehalococcoidia bacterium]|nr:hypothetical protein [Dehalococcoidia bacterium]
MEKWLLVVETNCTDSSKEKEFNRWYNNTHVPDVLSIQGILRATRYENPSPGEKQGKYVALYDVETKDILQTMATLNDNMTKWGEQGRVPKYLEIVSGCIYRQIVAPVKKKK